MASCQCPALRAHSEGVGADAPGSRFPSRVRRNNGCESTPADVLIFGCRQELAPHGGRARKHHSCASGGTADALASGASVLRDVGVQIPPRAQEDTDEVSGRRRGPLVKARGPLRRVGGSWCFQGSAVFRVRRVRDFRCWRVGGWAGRPRGKSVTVVTRAAGGLRRRRLRTGPSYRGVDVSVDATRPVVCGGDSPRVGRDGFT